MPSFTVKYYKKLTDTTFEPHSISIRERSLIMRRTGDAWCNDCYAVVSPDSKLDATGLVDVCPFCGSETEEPKAITCQHGNNGLVCEDCRRLAENSATQRYPIA